jgi:hypothetical protein
MSHILKILYSKIESEAPFDIHVEIVQTKAVENQKPKPLQI